MRKGKRDYPEMDRLILEKKQTIAAIAKAMGVHQSTVYNRRAEITEARGVGEDGRKTIVAATKRAWKDPKKRKKIIDGVRKAWKDPAKKAERMAKMVATKAERRRSVHGLPIDIKCDRCGIVLGISRRETRIVCLACVSKARADLLKTEFDTP